MVLCDISAEFYSAFFLSNTCDLFLRMFEVFNEVAMEINAINNKIFAKLYLKIRVKGKEI